MDAPDLETPGMSASAWDPPIRQASRSRSAPTGRSVRPMRSATPKMTPKTTSMVALTHSDRWLALARRRAEESGAAGFEVVEGRAEAIPVPGASYDAVLASLSLMYAIDREAAAREIARVLATEPSYVLLDEPFSGVDPLAVSEIQGAIGYLRTRGFEVRSAADGLSAIRLASEWHPDLIVMDLVLPILNGCEAARARCQCRPVTWP